MSFQIWTGPLAPARLLVRCVDPNRFRYGLRVSRWDPESKVRSRSREDAVWLPVKHSIPCSVTSAPILIIFKTFNFGTFWSNWRFWKWSKFSKISRGSKKMRDPTSCAAVPSQNTPSNLLPFSDHFGRQLAGQQKIAVEKRRRHRIPLAAYDARHICFWC